MHLRDALSGSLLDPADAEILMASAIGKPRTWVLAHPEHALTPEEWTTYTTWVERRRACEPVAYIVGEQEFYGRLFTVDSRVLIPRPSTEGLVRVALQFIEDGREVTEEVDEGIVVVSKRYMEDGMWNVATVVDVGTGSGCIAITLALERPDMKIIATDVSKDALDVARINAKRHGVSSRIEFLKGEGIEPIKDISASFLLVSNPPYIPKDKPLMKDVMEFEPHVALFGGGDGTDILRDIVTRAREHPKCVGFVVECGKEQSNRITE